jgi:hypothetical protein
MHEIGLTPNEFRVACYACRVVRVAGSTPAFVRALLTDALAPLRPDLAEKVARLRPRQMKVLRDRIGERQEAGCVRRRHLELFA